MDIAFFQLLTTSPQWQANFDVRTWTDFRTAVAVRCQHDRKHMLSPIRNCWQCQLQSSIFPLFFKKNELTSVKIKKNKNNRELFRWFMPSSCVWMECFSFRGKSEQKLYFSKFHILELLCMGNVLFWSKPFSVKMCMYAVPQYGQERERMCLFGAHTEILVDIRC